MIPCNADIILYARRVVEDAGFNLTPMSSAFFVELFRLVLDEGEKHPDNSMRGVRYSYRELSEKLDFSYEIVRNSMQLFLKCGLVVRKYIGMKKYVTYMDVSVFDEP